MLPMAGASSLNRGAIIPPPANEAEAHSTGPKSPGQGPVLFWTPKSAVLRSLFTATESSRFPRMNIVLAYLDPGTGSIILQSLVAGFFGALVLLKIYWGKITGFFRRDKNDPSVSAAESDDHQDPS